MTLAYHLKQTVFGRCLKRMLGALRGTASAPVQLRMLRKLSRHEQLAPVNLPAPYELLRYAPGDESRWLELLEASGEFGAWTPRRLSEEVLATLLPGGGLLLAHEGRLVGTASACFLEEYQPHAMLMYVTVRPDHRGKGLGQALVWETLRVCHRQGFPGMLLHTDDHRIPAVRSYFKLGFLPEQGTGAAGERRWSRVLSKVFFHSSEARPG
jgi:mycothiol synthase